VATEKQKAANRKNAARSTGPKTEEGKEKTRLNALKHGLTGALVVLPDEDQKEFDTLRNAVYSDFDPQGVAEEILAERIVSTTWKLYRLDRTEASVLTWYLYEVERRREYARSRRFVKVEPLLESLYPETITDPAAHAKAMKKVDAAQQKKLGPETAIAEATISDINEGGVIDRLKRYETSLTRILVAAMHELRALQSERRQAEEEIIDVEE